MNYQHHYHAGNLADVFKHVILSLFFSVINKKESAYTFFDTHAGEGVYDYLLFSKRFHKKHEESERGIQALWRVRQTLPEGFQPFLECLKEAQFSSNSNPDVLTRYPGSPFLASYFSRAQDSLVFNEAHPLAYQALKQYFYHDKRAHVHQRDAYECLLGLLPPKTKRAYVLIDPPYEKKREWMAIARVLSQGLLRFRQAGYLIWYPLTRDQATLPLLPALKTVLKQYEHSIVECLPASLAGSTGLVGSGMILIHPPYRLINRIQEVLPVLTHSLSDQTVSQTGHYRCYSV